MTNESIKTMDPQILLSLINTKLRDQYESLEALCDDLSITEEEIIKKLKSIGYEYNKESNQFKQYR